MEDIENSKLFKTLKALVLFEKECYSLYADASEKMSNPECRTILQTVSKQTKGHMNGLRRIYNEVIESYGHLDEETLNILTHIKDTFSVTEAEPAKILKACIDIEERMGEVYKGIAEGKELEAEFQELLGDKAQKESSGKLVDIIMQISAEEYYHREVLVEMLNKHFPESEKE